MQHIDLNELFLFAQVVDIGNFSATARKLDIPKTTISRRIANLEKRIGVQLIRRNTHQFSITPIGQQYYRYCKAMVSEAERAERIAAIHRNEPVGQVRLSCPKDILDQFINPMLIEFLQEHPQITLGVEVSEHHVDVQQGGFDFVIRARPERSFHLDSVVRRFGFLTQMLVASPRLVRRPVDNLQSLERYDCLSDQASGEWMFRHQEGGDHVFPFQAKIATKNLGLLRTALCAGQGIGIMPVFSIQNELDRGELISILPADWRTDDVIVHAAYPPHDGLLPAVSVLLDFLCDRFNQVAQGMPSWLRPASPPVTRARPALVEKPRS